MLARTTYNDTAAHDPAELLDAHRFPARESIEEHLLSVYTDALHDPRRSAGSREAAQPECDPNRARHCEIGIRIFGRAWNWCCVRRRARDRNGFTCHLTFSVAFRLV